MKLITHTNEIWKSRMKRMNGAYTYSEDLVKYQVPKWKETLDENGLLSTCPNIASVGTTGSYDTVVQYIHSYPYLRDVERIQAVINNSPFKYNRMVFVTAYKEYTEKLNKHKIETIYAPMGIDVKTIQEFEQPKLHSDRIVYFGNVVHEKVNLFNKLREACKQAGLEFDYISTGRLNAQIQLTREEILQIVSTYKYGIGVGRAAQEMMALGVKTLIAGREFGGLITTQDEYDEQLSTNMNGRIITYNSSLTKCLQDIDKSLTQANDITEMNHVELI